MSADAIDIPLPGEASAGSENVTSPTNGTDPVSVPPTNSLNVQTQTQAQLFHHHYYSAYYNAYAAATQQQPQYSFFVPVVPPVVPIIPMQHQQFAQDANKTDDDDDDVDDDDDDDDPTVAKTGATKANNILPIHCDPKMGLNPLIFTNIQQSPYFKNNLFQLKTYHEVIDEIFYSVKHLEPWEKGSRKIGGQTGMCGSVRGVGAGGIISTPFCILYKLFTLKLTRKQVNGLIRHKDSPYIRALGFMYIRFTQPPAHLWQWFSPFLEDEEEVDPKAGGGQPMTVGQMCRHMLTKLDWFSTLFPRIPVPIQKDIEAKMKKHDAEMEEQLRAERGMEEGEVDEEREEPVEKEQRRYDIVPHKRRSSSRERKRRSRSNSKERSRDSRRSRDRSRSRERRSRSRDRHRQHRRASRSPHSHHKRDSRDQRERVHHKHKNHRH